jgi:hypothetical protein
VSESSANPGAWKVGGSQVGEGGEAPAFGVELITNRSKVSYGQENYYVGGDRKDRPDCCYRGLGETNRGVADQRMVCNWSCRNSKNFQRSHFAARRQLLATCFGVGPLETANGICWWL